MEKLTPIKYIENVLSHHPKTIFLWISQGIVIDDKRYIVKEFRLRDSKLYAVIAENKYDTEYFEVQLGSGGMDEEALKPITDRITALENKEDKDTTYTGGSGITISAENVISRDPIASSFNSENDTLTIDGTDIRLQERIEGNHIIKKEEADFTDKFYQLKPARVMLPDIHTVCWGIGTVNTYFSFRIDYNIVYDSNHLYKLTNNISELVGLHAHNTANSGTIYDWLDNTLTLSEVHNNEGYSFGNINAGSFRLFNKAMIITSNGKKVYSDFTFNNSTKKLSLTDNDNDELLNNPFVYFELVMEGETESKSKSILIESPDENATGLFYDQNATVTNDSNLTELESYKAYYTYAIGNKTVEVPAGVDSSVYVNENVKVTTHADFNLNEFQAYKGVQLPKASLWFEITDYDKNLNAYVNLMSNNVAQENDLSELPAFTDVNDNSTLVPKIIYTRFEVIN